jgi:hypothetical protein
MEKLELQAEQEYTLILTGEEIVAYINWLSDKPFKEVGVLIPKVVEQLQQQINKEKNG